MAQPTFPAEPGTEIQNEVHRPNNLTENMEREHVRETPLEEEAESDLQTPQNPLISLESEGGENPLANKEAIVNEGTSGERVRRQIKPVTPLTYDEPGKPIYRPLTAAHRGVVVHISSPMCEKSQCNTVWCHPMAQCPKCAIRSDC